MPTVPHRSSEEAIRRLEYVVFGFDGNEDTGLVRRIDRLNSRIDRLNWALTAAALSFGVGTLSIVATVLIK